MTAPNPPVARLQLGQLLRELREKAGRTQDDAAATLECKKPKVSKIETGKATIGPGDARLLIDLYGTQGDTAETVVRLAREARKRSAHRVPDWAQRFVALESIAASIQTYEPELVPGLLQTEEYTRAITRAADPDRESSEVERLVGIRKERQVILNSDEPPRLSVVLNEAVLRRRVGGPEIMAEQLHRVRTLAERSWLDLRVLPFSAGEHAAMGASFRLVEMSEPAGARVVYVEDLSTADYLDGSAQVARYARAFERLHAAALSPADSYDLLDQAILGYTHESEGGL